MHFVYFTLTFYSGALQRMHLEEFIHRILREGNKTSQIILSEEIIHRMIRSTHIIAGEQVLKHKSAKIRILRI